MAPKKLVDAHCHLETFKPAQLEALPKDIIPVTSGYSHHSNWKTLEIAQKLNVPFCMGIAPQTVLREGTKHLDSWMQFIAESNPNAVGEVGLDYHWGTTKEDYEAEESVFREMVELARTMDKPLVIHSRKAESRVLDILEEVAWKKPFMMHFFAGGLDEAARAVDMGGIISVVGLPSKKRKKVVSEIPLEKLVVETDAPYVTRNIDGVHQSIEYVSRITGIPTKEVGEVTAKNAAGFFGFKL